ncbi:hypothetical protein B4Q13_23265, partial [Lacticaseibacillus rhamnosus]
GGPAFAVDGDRAVLEHSELHHEVAIPKWSKVDEIPFDFSRRIMSVVVQTPEGIHRLISKGAPEAVIDRCSSFELDELSGASTAFTLAFNIGALTGPIVAGVAMQFWNPHGMLVVIGVAGAALTIVAVRLAICEQPNSNNVRGKPAHSIMSAVGRTRPRAAGGPTSGFTPIADSNRPNPLVS